MTIDTSKVRHGDILLARCTVRFTTDGGFYVHPVDNEHASPMRLRNEHIEAVVFTHVAGDTIIDAAGKMGTVEFVDQGHVVVRYDNAPPRVWQSHLIDRPAPTTAAEAA